MLILQLDRKLISISEFQSIVHYKFCFWLLYTSQIVHVASAKHQIPYTGLDYTTDNLSRQIPRWKTIANLFLIHSSDKLVFATHLSQIEPNLVGSPRISRNIVSKNDPANNTFE